MFGAPFWIQVRTVASSAGTRSWYVGSSRGIVSGKQVAAVILFDPIFQGLALSLAAGEVASLLISRMAVPVLYAMVRGREQPTVEPGPAEHRDGLTVLEGGAGPGVASVG